MPPNDAAPAAPVDPELAALDPGNTPGLDDPAPGAAPGVSDQAGAAPGASQPASPDARRDAALVARMGIDWIIAAVVRQYPVLSYPEATRERAADLAGAVLAKHDLFGWLAKWREEFQLGAFVVGIAWQSYQVVQKAKATPPPVNDPPKPAAP